MWQRCMCCRVVLLLQYRASGVAYSNLTTTESEREENDNQEEVE